MKKALFTSLILFSVLSFSQEKILNIGLNYSSVFNNYNFINPVYDEFGWETSYEYKSKYNYSTGISFDFFKKIYLGTDLNYTTKAYILEYNFTSFYINDPTMPIRSTVEAGYLDINLNTGYYFNLNKIISVIPNIKFIYSGLINNQITTLSGDNKEYTSKNGKGILIKQDLVKNLFSSGIGLNIKCDFTKVLSFGIEPILIYSFKKISDKALKTNDVFYLLKFGLYYKINKNEN